jgi:uncharacterized coiled-coil DUF342 family protein
MSAMNDQMQKALAATNAKLDSTASAINSKFDAKIAELQATDAAQAKQLADFKGEYNSFVDQTKAKFASQDAQISKAFSELNDTKAQLTGQIKDVEARLTAAMAAGDSKLQAQLNDQKAQLTTAQNQLNQHAQLLVSQQNQINAQRTEYMSKFDQVNSSITNVNVNIQNQINVIKGDVNQLFANDNSFATQLSQWHTALESWRGAHILVNANMQGKVHTRFDPLVLDMKGDGIDIGGKATTDLVTGEAANLNWTKAGTDDAFLMVDATSLRALGWDLKNGDGTAVDGNTLFRDGLTVTDKAGNTVQITDGYSLLAALDSDRDGKVNSSDPAWQALRLFVDTDGDGTVGRNELSNISDSAVRDLATSATKAMTFDAAGNALTDGAFTRADGTAGYMSDVNFAGAQ